jgi:hypothetical protein
MRARLCIVSPYRPDVFDEALHAIVNMGAAAQVEVFFDRRIGERRNPGRAASDDSCRADRRRLSIEDELRRDGFAIVWPE